MPHSYSVYHAGSPLLDIPQPLHIRGGCVVAHPARHSPAIDLSASVVLPAFINAHDHLELNHYPRTRFRDCYGNAHEWGQDVNARLSQPPFDALRRYPLWERCFIGGLKNLLCGVTTVAQHGALHPPLRRADFPVRVLARYGWAHSLHFETLAQVQKSYRRTPKRQGWFIHLAEGTDTTAQAEYQQLSALGCMGTNTVLIHAVGITRPADLDALAKQPARGVVTCPTTNRYLLGCTHASPLFQQAAQTVAIGSDSRLTADGDLLDELHAGASFLMADNAHLLATVTRNPAKILGLPQIGHLEVGARADWIALPHDDLSRLRRADVQLVVRDGVPLIGDPPLMAKFPQVPTIHATLDGIPKAVHRRLAQHIHACNLKERGLLLGG